jgi:integrase
VIFLNNNEKLTGAANRINRALQHQLSLQNRFGQSKHEAKQAARGAYLKEHGNLKGYNPSKVDGIFSINTMESYRQTAREFAIWAADNGCKNANKITRDMAGRYLQERQAEGKSMWTISKDMAAINKLFKYDLTKAELGLQSRSLKEVTRSRNATANDKRDFSRYKDQITFAKATGCRRQSIKKVKPEDCICNAQGKVVAVRLTEKGGKTRTAPVLNKYKNKLTEVVDKHSNPGKPLFDTYDSHIDNHAFRSEYATALLQQLENEKAVGAELCGGDFDPHTLVNLRGRDAETDAPYRGHDRDICGMVSGALGHNRLCVIFESYIR